MRAPPTSRRLADSLTILAAACADPGKPTAVAPPDRPLTAEGDTVFADAVLNCSQYDAGQVIR
jgi:hypothetical protein